MPVRRSTAQPARTVGSTVAAGAKAPAETSKPTPAGNTGSFASVFDQTPAATGFGGADVPPGKYEAIIVYAQIQDPNDKGLAVLVKYEIADDGDHQGKVLSSYYGLIGKDGHAAPGAGFLKRDLVKMGFDDLKGDDLPDALKEIADEMAGVAITVKLNQGYTNVYLDGPMDNSEIIEKWKSERPEKPF